MFFYNKFLHFVFADETDSYFIESGTKLNFHFYLWYQLCKSGFEGVYFLEGAKQNLRLEILDEKSYKAYQPKSFFKGFGKVRKYCKEERVWKVENFIKYSSWMLGQMKKGKRAFVIPLDTFYSILEDSEMQQILDRLIDLSGEKTQSSIILTAPMQSEETLKLLKGWAFQYCNGSGQPLCRELYDILNKKEQVSFYEALYEEMNGAAVFLNVFNKEQIRQLVYAAQYRQSRDFCSEIVLESITDYVFYWCRSENMQESERILTASARQVRFTGLYEQMCDENTWRKLRKAAANFHVSKQSDRIEKLYPDLQNRMGVFYHGKVGCDKEISKYIDEIELEQYKEYGGSRDSVLQFEKFKIQMGTPTNWMLCREVEEYVVRFLNELRHTAGECLYETDELDIIDAVFRVEKMIEALSFSRKYLWKNPAMEETAEIRVICELYMQYLDILKSKHWYSAKRRRLSRKYDKARKDGLVEAELQLELENATKKEEFIEHAEKEAEKQLKRCKTNLEEHHFESIREILKTWETETGEKKKITVFDSGEKDKEDDPMQEKYDFNAAKRIAKMFQ